MLHLYLHLQHLHWAELTPSSCLAMMGKEKKPAGIPPSLDLWQVPHSISPAVKCTLKSQPKPLAAPNPCG